jgi:hypothetical protein
MGVIRRDASTVKLRSVNERRIEEFTEDLRRRVGSN